MFSKIHFPDCWRGQSLIQQFCHSLSGVPILEPLRYSVGLQCCHQMFFNDAGYSNSNMGGVNTSNSLGSETRTCFILFITRQYLHGTINCFIYFGFTFQVIQLRVGPHFVYIS